jgi:hypothetical protein
VNEGTLSPGNSIGRLTLDTSVDGGFGQTENGLLEIEIGGELPAIEYDQLLVSGQAELGGNLSVTLVDSGTGPFAPQAGDTFEVLRAHRGLQGTFRTMNAPPLSDNLMWEIDYLADAVVIRVIANGAFVGDYDGDGAVDQSDLDLVLLNWGADGKAPPMGWTNDLPTGNIDQDELDGVLLNWGNMATEGLGSAATVPEPATLLLVAVLLAATFGSPCRIFRRGYR